MKNEKIKTKKLSSTNSASVRSSAVKLAGKQKSKTVKKETKVASGIKKKDLVSPKIAKKTTAASKKTEKIVLKTAVQVKKIEQKETKNKVKITTPTAKVFDKDGKVVEEMKLPADIFAAKVNPALMAQAVRVYLANQRAGSASTKTRGEVRGSTRKIYRQKGTGRARHGAITAPIFVGGGITFGPKPRDFSLNLPRKMKRKALFSALTQKFQDNQVLVLNNILDFKPKTKEFLKMIAKFNLLNKKGKADSVLLVLPEKLDNFELAARNIEGLEIEKANLLNTYEVLKNKNIVFMKDSIDILSKTFLRK